MTTNVKLYDNHQMKTTKTKRKKGSGLKARILITKARVGRHFLFYFKNHVVYYKVRKINAN